MTTDAELLEAQVATSTDPQRMKRMAVEAAVRDFVKLLPPHKASLTIQHNAHIDVYLSIRDYLEDIAHPDDVIDYESLIKGNELWSVQVYPSTPIGSYTIYGPTLESVMLRILEENQT